MRSLRWLHFGRQGAGVLPEEVAEKKGKGSWYLVAVHVKYSAAAIRHQAHFCMQYADPPQIAVVSATPSAC